MTGVGLGVGLTDLAVRSKLPDWLASKLFDSGEQGALYEPDEITSLYKTPTGTIEAPVAGNTIGLVLDKKSWGSSTLAEILSGETNLIPADFTNSKWLFTNVSGSGAITATTLHFADPFDRVTARADAARTWLVGETFRVDITISGTGRCRLFAITGTGTTILLVDTTLTADPVRHTFNFFNNTEGLNAGFGIYGASTTSGTSPLDLTLHDFSFKQISGRHARQQTSGLRPVYAVNPSRLDHDGVDDVLTAALPDMGANATVAYAAGGAITYLEAQTIAAGNYNLPTADWTACLAINRSLTATEKEQLSQAWL